MLFFHWPHIRLPRWKQGRQQTGYEVLTLFNSKRLHCDLHLLRYREGSRIPSHRDPVEEPYEHFRLNIEVWRAELGGTFVAEKWIFNWKRIHLFRPDKYYHGVSEVLKGTRYVLSLGWKRRKKNS